MGEHTPGPWYWAELPDYEGCPRIGVAQERVGWDVCNLLFADPHLKSRESNKADARLISASPRMYDFVKMHAVEHGDVEARAIVAEVENA